MPTSLIEADSLLALDVGTVTTRAMLFDVVEGRYRYIGSGTAPTTAGHPVNDASNGVHKAIFQLQEVTGRILFGKDGRLLIPANPNGNGVDVCVATLSAGSPLRVVLVGLLEDVSVESAQRLAETVYSEVVDKLSLNDRRRSAARMDALLGSHPDVIIVTGGTERGASQSVLDLLDSVTMSLYMMPESSRPDVLYAGNNALSEQVEENLSSLTSLSVAANIRPGLDAESLSSAQNSLASIYRNVRARTIPGVHELDTWTGGRLSPTSTAFARVIRFLSKVYGSNKGVLGIDIGAASLSLAAAFAGDLYQGVYSDLGLGERLDRAADRYTLEEILAWVTGDVTESSLLNYLYNKKINPGAVPSTQEELAIEQALVRKFLSTGMQRLCSSFPKSVWRTGSWSMPWFEPIILAGSAFTKAPNLGQSLLMLLDGLQPVGVTTVVLDQNGITPALGAAAVVNTLLPVQVLESSTFLNLGTVISLASPASAGSPVLRVRVNPGSGGESLVEVRNGTLEVIPLATGETAKLHLQPLNRADIGMGGPGRGGSMRISGGALGVVIDARGRPLRLPKDDGKRKDLLKKWAWSLTG
jgi:hypothetical protein